MPKKRTARTQARWVCASSRSQMAEAAAARKGARQVVRVGVTDSCASNRERQTGEKETFLPASVFSVMLPSTFSPLLSLFPRVVCPFWSAPLDRMNLQRQLPTGATWPTGQDRSDCNGQRDATDRHSDTDRGHTLNHTPTHVNPSSISQLSLIRTLIVVPSTHATRLHSNEATLAPSLVRQPQALTRRPVTVHFPLRHHDVLSPLPLLVEQRLHFRRGYIESCVVSRSVSLSLAPTARLHGVDSGWHFSTREFK